MTSSGEFPGEFQTGDIVGDTYMVVDYLGRGAMGHVYHVRHQMLNTEYALKTLSSDKVTELAWRRFQNEAQAIAILNHRNVVSIYNLGLHRGSLPFYVMDYLQGVDLGQRIQAGGPLELKQAVQIFIEVCAGISYAHKKGIIHRDIKPGNIFLLERPTATGATVKVVDFGIAKLSQTKNQKNQELTGMGDVVGTPYYMSPEQCMGQRVDARSDIYSLGCTLFEALTGVLPFRGRNPIETMLLHQSSPPPSLNKASGGKAVADRLEYIVATALAKEQSDRYQTMDQLAKDLSAVIEGDKPVMIAPRPATIDTFEEIPLLDVQSFKDTPEHRWLLPVAPVVAGLLVLCVCAYWQFSPIFNKHQQLPLSEQLEKFKPTLADKMPSTSDEARMVFNQQDTNPSGETSGYLLPRHQTVTSSLLTKTPFSTIKSEDGTSFRYFDFPLDIVIGLIESQRQEKPTRAVGLRRFPIAQQLTFTPAEIVGRYPDCLKRFQPDDIYCVKLDPSACTDQIFKATLNLRGVKMIDFTKCRGVTTASFDTMKQFHHLTVFHAPDSNIDGTLLARCKCWESLEDLNLSSTNDVLPMLQALKNAKLLNNLRLAKCKLSAQDFKAVAALPNLTYLDLSGNQMTNEDLALLSALKNLTELHIKNTGLDASVVNILQHFKALNRLVIGSKRLRPDQLQKIKAALPAVRVT